MLAETFRKRWIQASSAAFNDDFRGYQNDISVAGKGLKGQFDRFLFFLWALFHFDIFHFFWGVSLWSWWRFHLLDLPLLKLFGKKVIVHFRGLDVVDISYFDYLREKNRGQNVTKPPLSRPDQQRKLKKWLRYADHVLVSEPDLFDVVPKGDISPQVIDMSYWKSSRMPLSENDHVIRIVHAPSSRRKKGTDFIEQAILELKKKGYRIELVLAEKLPHHKIKELYENSDIGIDQVLYGWHGKVSVELMALGRPVVCFIEDRFLKYRPTLPIVSATPATLVAELERLINDKELRIEIGKRSQEYVSKYHDVERVTDQLLQIYGFEAQTFIKERIPDAKMW